MNTSMNMKFDYLKKSNNKQRYGYNEKNNTINFIYSVHKYNNQKVIKIFK